MLSSAVHKRQVPSRRLQVTKLFDTNHLILGH